MGKDIRRVQSLQFNMTPMIDVVFLLIIFFMLASRFVSAEHAEIQLPDPQRSQAAEMKLPEKVVINVQLGPDDRPQILVGPIRCADLAELSTRLQIQKSQSPELQVVLRADKRVKYSFVRDVLKTVADNQIELINIAAKREPG